MVTDSVASNSPRSAGTTRVQSLFGTYLVASGGTACTVLARRSGPGSRPDLLPRQDGSGDLDQSRSARIERMMLPHMSGQAIPLKDLRGSFVTVRAHSRCHR